MPTQRRVWRAAGALALGIATVTAATTTATATSPSPKPGDGAPSLVGGAFADCFWNYGAVSEDPYYNIAYPDAGAVYWAAYIRRPAGSTISLAGTYPHSRYFSFISYDRVGQPVDGIADYQIPADADSANPFSPGARRNTPDSQRSYRVDLVHDRNLKTAGNATTPAVPLYTIRDPRDDEPQRNDLRMVATGPALGYPGVPLQKEVGSDGVTYDTELMLMRVYVPDRGVDITGGVGLPQPTLTLADGTALTGQAACDAMDSESKDLKKTSGNPSATRLPDPTALTIPESQYRALRYPWEIPVGQQVQVYPPAGQPGAPLFAVHQDPADKVAYPAVYHPGAGDRSTEWRAQYDRRYLLQLWTGDEAPGASLDPSRTGGGFFPNIHNNYIRTALHRSFGEVAVIRGRLPKAISTRDHTPVMGSAQVRYASFCMNESVYTTRVMDCVFDEEVPVDANGSYTIVVSSEAARPKTANSGHRAAWVEWKHTGDGYEDHDFGWFQIRNMLPSTGFHQAVQDTVTPGDEAAVMGDYLPQVTYMTTADFDRLNRGR